MPLNYGIVSDGSCIVITDVTTLTKIETIPKEKVVLQIVLASEVNNKSGIDELWIQHDGQYSVEIPYTQCDVESAGVAPASVELFRSDVLALLNDNSYYGLSTGGHIRGLISQSGSGAGDHPTLIIQKNTTGLTLTATRNSVGNYTLTPSTPFVEDETWYMLSHKISQGGIGIGNAEGYAIFFLAGNLAIETGDITNPTKDGLLSKTPFLIIID